MIKKSLIKHVIDVIPIDDRMMTIVLRGTRLFSLINVYMFTAARSAKNASERYPFTGSRVRQKS